MRNLLFILLLVSSSAFAGEDVTVSWTPPSDLATLPYDGYNIQYTDSLGASFIVPVNDPLATEHVISNVEFGSSQWSMTSTCALCTISESLPSPTIDFVVKAKPEPKAPNTITITVTVVVN